jgi:hypothetical protein
MSEADLYRKRHVAISSIKAIADMETHARLVSGVELES